ncbi:hypothetical protein DUI87_26860 [Hirundo rustica rustica]|uniref:Uncharacterized protein n=1 Tax=Hirundo rustica rustica TaxID=333673 RepID=A0A3M0J794_HIRRU|nr:hypothetical protein DUI87_26860 [Hirundo rustica rustica]
MPAVTQHPHCRVMGISVDCGKDRTELGKVMTFLLPINACGLRLQVYSPLSHQKTNCKPLGLSIPDPLELGVCVAEAEPMGAQPSGGYADIRCSGRACARVRVCITKTIPVLSATIDQTVLDIATGD